MGVNGWGICFSLPVLFLFVLCVELLEVSSIHDGHDQTKFLLCLEGISQGHNEATVNLLKYSLLHHRPLQENIWDDSFEIAHAMEKQKYGGKKDFFFVF